MRVDDSGRGLARDRVRALLRGGGANLDAWQRSLYAAFAMTYVRKVTVD